MTGLDMASDSAMRLEELHGLVKKWAQKAARSRHPDQGRTYRRLAQCYRKMLKAMLRERRLAGAGASTAAIG